MTSIKKSGENPKTSKENLKDLYPLTSMQEGMLFHSLYEGKSGTFLEQLFCTIQGELNVHLFEESWNELFKRHEVLRTILIPKKAASALQMVLKSCSVPFEYEDIQHLSEEGRREFLENYQTTDRERGFNLERDLLMRVAVFQTSSDRYEILWTHHHILMDGWSCNLVFGQLIEIYKALVDGKSLNYTQAPPYSRFIQWLKQQNADAAKVYWTQYLEGYDSAVKMPRSQRGKGRGRGRGGYESSTFAFDLDSQTTQQLEQLARKLQVTLNSIVQSIWAVMLAKYHDIDDVVFGTTVSGRPPEIKGVEEIVGLFINTIPVRVRVEDDLSFVQLIQQVQSDAIASKDYTYYSLADIQALSKHKSGLIDHAIVFQNYPTRDEVRDALETKHYGFSVVDIKAIEQNNYDLSAIVSPGEQLKIGFLYNAKVFSTTYIQRLESHLRNIIQAVLGKPEITISDIPIISDREKVLISEFNATDAEFDRDCTIIEAIENQVSQTPDATAVYCAGRNISYRELSASLLKIATYLRTEAQVQKGDLVGILLKPSENFILAVLGTMKAGGGFLALDPKAPIKRNREILRESHAVAVITDATFSAELEDFPGNVLVLGDRDDYQIASSSPVIPVAVTPNDLAYVIFTSGSTGKPKGIAVNHRSLFHYIQWCEKFYFSKQDMGNMPLFTSPAFDLTITSLFCPLVRGKMVVVMEGEEIDETLKQIIDLEDLIDTIKLTPAHISALKHLGVEKTTIRLAIVGGEELKKEQVETLLALNPEMKIYNEYGPAEATVGCIAGPVIDPERITIGKPIDNTKIHILNQHLQPVPIGCIGEIHIAGTCLAEGYWKTPDLTAVKFIDNPLSPGNRLYRSGDLGKWLENGEIISLGRKDDQIKIRGHRVELGEIETVLKQNPGIEDAIVLWRDSQNKEQHLSAYLIPSATQASLMRRLAKLIQTDPSLQDQIHSLPNGLLVFGINRKETDYLYEEIFEQENYLAYEISISDGDVVFDVGANIGMFSLLINQRCPSAQIYAFEPMGVPYEILSKNAALYGSNIRCYPFGFSCEETERIFTYYPTNTVMSGIYGDVEDDKSIVRSFILNEERAKGHAGTILTPQEMDTLLEDRMQSSQQVGHLRRLSSVLRELDVSRIDLLKIDVEKSEIEVLDGIDEEDWHKIKQVILEVHDIDGRLLQVKQRLMKYGFEIQVAQDNLLLGTNLYKIYGRRAEIQDLNLSNPPSEQNPPRVSEWVNPEMLIENIRSFLSSRLPDYMIPSDFQFVDRFPLTRNGKRDLKALVESGGLVQQKQKKAEVLPTTHAEKVLAEIWHSLLGVKRVGIDDDFFALGGHSLKALMLLSRIRKVLGVEISLKSVFEFSTIRTLGELVSASKIYSDRFGKDQMILLNPDCGKYIFALPTVLGYGIGFKGLSQHLNSYSVYGLDFIEDDDPVARYAELLTQTQPEGLYILLGYCAGGNLAFELAKNLENSSRQVSDIIMLDSTPRSCKRNESEKAIAEQVDAEIGYYYSFLQDDPDLSKLLENQHFKAKLKSKMTAYMRYMNELVNDGVIVSNIHLIRSEENQSGSDNTSSWVDRTTGKVSIYNGSGNHGDMLVNEHLQQNAFLMNQILEQILQKGSSK